MKPTEILIREHMAIRRALRILGQICEKWQSGEGVNTDHLSQILEFIRVFSDQCHHGKEEGCLFPALVEAGVQKEGGPVGAMLMEHQMGRGYVREMGEALEQYKKGDSQSASQFIGSAQNYMSLLEHHIMKENNILFPMADQVLSALKQIEISKGFERIEEEKIGLGRHESFHALLEQLSKIYLEEIASH